MIAGDFNAWAIVCGSKKTNARGRCLLKAFAQLHVVLENEGDVNIYRKGRTGSIVDLAFVSPALASGMFWQVSEEFTYSDHRAITFELWMEPQGRRPASWKPKPKRTPGSSAKPMDEQTFMEV